MHFHLQDGELDPRAIQGQGGVELTNGDCVMPDPILVGRNENKLKALARDYGVERWSTDLDEALSNLSLIQI